MYCTIHFLRKKPSHNSSLSNVDTCQDLIWVSEMESTRRHSCAEDLQNGSRCCKFRNNSVSLKPFCGGKFMANSLKRINAAALTLVYTMYEKYTKILRLLPRRNPPKCRGNTESLHDTHIGCIALPGVRAKKLAPNHMA